MIKGELHKSKENRFLTGAKNLQLLTFLFAILFVAISLITHEIWQDEAEPIFRVYLYGWNLWALMESFRGDLHLPPYYVLLYPMFNIGHRVLGFDIAYTVKFLTFLQYAFLAYLTIKWIRFPFSALFLLSYYCVFEYGTISRCYLLALILLLTIFKGLTSRKEVSIWGALACFLFPLTHLLSLIFSVPLLIYCLVKRYWMRLGAITASYPIAFYYYHFRSEASKGYEFQERLSISEYSSTFLKSIVSAWLPFTTNQTWWNQSFAIHFTAINLIFTILLLALIAMAIIRLYKFDSLLTVACGFGGLLGVAVLTIKYPLGNFRHTGYVVWPFICLLALVLSCHTDNQETKSQNLESEQRQYRLNRGLQPIFTLASIAILATHSFFGLSAVYKDITGVFSFPMAQLEVIQQLHKDSKLKKPTVYDYPGGSSLAIATLSDWSYKFVPIWSLADKNCEVDANNSENPTNDSAVSGSAKCPRRIIVTTWAVPLQGFPKEGNISLLNSANDSFEDAVAQKFFGQSVGKFLSERSFECEQVAAFRGSQTVDEYTYECRRRTLRQNL
ncbi:hypothetical protein IQ268_06805 [Oculatella sp. LEGE 06141]|uniref:hypothetical protein n=1 Tax=Oculatella sp. LEGE 06141 TaxID=1828648 RepID=UPI001881D62E|nr:hypothetical protein [Oculatella sp. LEGE 06141]MBE9178295.1 hypothetical protein [Oculatella sp. LEGE 06141]